MRKIKLFCLSVLLLAGTVQAQYLVKTAAQRNTTGTDEELFVEDNYPFYSLCDWKPGLKFMFISEGKYSFISVFKSFDTDRDVDNAKLQYRIFELVDITEVGKETHVGTSYSTRFVFDSDGEKFYHEFKNKRLGEICASDARVHIPSLVFLGDVDKAKELLEGITMYLQTSSVRVDDPNSSNSYRDVKIDLNQEVTITAVGVGNREYPVKIVFEDKNGNSYYKEVAFSTTNSGLTRSDFVGARLESYFPNAFYFNDKAAKTIEDIKSKYIGRPAYPRKTVTASKDGVMSTLVRYTPLKITDLSTAGGTKALLTVRDREGHSYTVDVDMKYDVFIKNDNYIDDLFGYNDLRAQYPSITEKNWDLISAGEVRVEMTKDECRLALGSPIQIVANINSKYETWFYHGKTLDFDGNSLMRIK